jgi:hypothetical protein
VVDAREELTGTFLGAKVGRDAIDFAADLASDFGDSFVDARFGASVDVDEGALAGEEFGDGESDARG